DGPVRRSRSPPAGVGARLGLHPPPVTTPPPPATAGAPSTVRGVVRKRVLVAGLVQGVAFRDTCRRAALENRVTGWVRNLPDGPVGAACEGEPGGVGRMVARARRGPARAVVESGTVVDEEPEGLTSFRIV